MKEVRVLLAGIGGYGHVYLDEWQRMQDPSVTIAGICELKDGLEEMFPVIREKQIPIYHSVEEFYAEQEADLAILSTPIHLHHSQAVYCMEHGSNVLLEKPVCTTMEEAADLLNKEKETGRFVAIGYQMNYDPEMKRMKQDVLDGVFGKPLSMKVIHGFRRGYKYYHRNNWAGRIEVNGCLVNDSPFNNSNAHQFQSMLFLLGRALDRAANVTDVEAELYRANSQVENFDTAAVRVMTDCGVPVYYYTTHEGKDAEFGPIAEFKFENAVITIESLPEYDGERRYVARWNDGRTVVYGGLDYTKRIQKMYDAIESTRMGTHPVCTVQTASSHLDAVSRLAKLPIRDIAPENLEPWTLDGDQMLHIRNLEESFRTCFDQEKLPSECGIRWD